MDKFYMALVVILVAAISFVVNYGLALAGYPSSLWIMRALGVM